jgi:quinol monooxygenase YgiN
VGGVPAYQDLSDAFLCIDLGPAEACDPELGTGSIRTASMTGGPSMPLFIFARIDPKPGFGEEVREELRRVIEPTRAEPGCVRIHFYESIREPLIFFIHSEWTDEAAFDAHVEMPHTRRFVSAVEPLITDPVRAVRTKEVY